MNLGEVAGVAASLGAGVGARGERRTRRGRDGLLSIVPVEVPLEKSIRGRINLGTLDTSGNLGAGDTAGDLDVEGLRPELALGDGAVVVDGSDFSTEDIVAAGQITGESDGLLIVVVVENGVGTPVTGLLLGLTLGEAARAVVDEGALVNLEEFELGLVDVLAVAVAGSKPGSSPAVVAAVPPVLVSAALALVVPGEGHLGAGSGLGSIGRWLGVDVGDDVGIVDLVTEDGLVAPALVGPPSRGLVSRVLEGALVETFVGLAADLPLLDHGVGRDGGEHGSQGSAGREDLRHGRHFNGVEVVFEDG